jgi:hypothetical protein
MRKSVRGGFIDLRSSEIDASAIDDLRTELMRCDGNIAVDLRDSTFLGSVDFSGLTFGRSCDFSGSRFQPASARPPAPEAVCFAEVTFRVPARFERVTFDVQVTFEASRFSRAANFHRAHFIDASFRDALFESTATFTDTSWAMFKERPVQGRAELSSARFEDHVDFDRAAFGVPPEFVGTGFNGPVSFRDVTRSGPWTFESTRFAEELTIRSTPMEECGREPSIEMAGVIWTAASRVSVGSAPLSLRSCVMQAPVTIAAEHSPGERPTTPLGAMTDCSVLAPMTLDGLLLTETSFRGSTGLDHLRFPSSPEWPRVTEPVGPWRNRAALADDLRSARREDPDSLEAEYRQLRAGLEASRAAPDAADFYIGELDARRRDDGTRWIDKVLLSGYRHVGGYGVRAGPPLFWFAVMVTVTAGLFRTLTAYYVRRGARTVDGYHLQRFWDAFAFVLRSSINLFSTPSVGLTPGGTILLVFVRYAGVALLALAVFALRSRVVR